MSTRPRHRQEKPDCMERVDATRYRCSRYGWVIDVQQLPIGCRCPDRIPASQVRSPAAGLPQEEEEEAAIVQSWRRAAEKRIARLRNAGSGMADAAELDRRLRICVSCDDWMGTGCKICDGCRGRARYVVMLAAGVPFCKKWKDG